MGLIPDLLPLNRALSDFVRNHREYPMEVGVLLSIRFPAIPLFVHKWKLTARSFADSQTREVVVQINNRVDWPTAGLGAWSCAWSNCYSKYAGAVREGEEFDRGQAHDGRFIPVFRVERQILKRLQEAIFHPDDDWGAVTRDEQSTQPLPHQLGQEPCVSRVISTVNADQLKEAA